MDYQDLAFLREAIEQSRRNLKNLVIVDLLPAGLEIENPELAGSARVGTGPNRRCLTVRHMERRDDRMLIFGDVYGGGGEHVYVVRAVTAGSFAPPAAEASCMYDPGIYSVHGAGTVEIGR